MFHVVAAGVPERHACAAREPLSRVPHSAGGAPPQEPETRLMTPMTWPPALIGTTSAVQFH